MNTALKVDDYWLIVSDEEIKYDDWYAFPTIKPKGYSISQYLDNEELDISLGNLKAKKVIATSKKIGELPLFDVPVEWENVDDELKENLIILSKAWMTANDHKQTNMEAFIENVVMPQVNKAKEKYQFTEEDIKEALRVGCNIGMSRFNPIPDNGELIPHWDTEKMVNDCKKHLSSLTKQKQYEVEIEHTEGKVKILNWKEL